jgi:hypothetical protein
LNDLPEADSNPDVAGKLHLPTSGEAAMHVANYSAAASGQKLTPVPRQNVIRREFLWNQRDLRRGK